MILISVSFIAFYHVLPKTFEVILLPRSLDSISILHIIVHIFLSLWSISASRPFTGVHNPFIMAVASYRVHLNGKQCR